MKRATVAARAQTSRRRVSVRAPAKINLSLRVGARRPDGYHDIQTVFQSLALHDTVRCDARPGPFAIVCQDDAVPTDRANLIWRAADLLWRRVARTGELRDVAVQLTKRIPVQAGLGGGSSDAVAVLRALAVLWGVKRSPETLVELAASIGADAPFFVSGGTACGLGRGDDVYPMIDAPRWGVVIAMPRFGVSTADAYRWVDEDRAAGIGDPPSQELRRTSRGSGIGDQGSAFAKATADEPESKDNLLPTGWPGGSIRVVNDFEASVSRRHPQIAETTAALRSAGALVSAMAGSGASVFGLFPDARRARRAATAMAGFDGRLVVTDTLPRAEFIRSVRPSTRP